MPQYPSFICYYPSRYRYEIPTLNTCLKTIYVRGLLAPNTPVLKKNIVLVHMRLSSKKENTVCLIANTIVY